MKGRRGRGKPRTIWIVNIKRWTNLNYSECIGMVHNREQWRSLVHNDDEDRGSRKNYKIGAHMICGVPSGVFGKVQGLRK